MLRTMHATLLVLAASLSGCFALSDTDRFVEDEGCDLELKIRSFVPHAGQRLTVKLVQDRSPEEAGAPTRNALVVVDPLETLDLDIRLPGAVRPLFDTRRPRARIDFYADANENGTLDMPPTDHSWRLPDACVDGPVVFEHNVDFDTLDLPPNQPTGFGNDIELRFCEEGLEEYADSPIEIRVEMEFPPEGGLAEEFRPVAAFRVRRRDDRGAVLLPSVVDSGFPVRITIFFDQDADGEVDPEDLAIGYATTAETPDCPALPSPCIDMLPGRRSVCNGDGGDLQILVNRSRAMPPPIAPEQWFFPDPPFEG